VKIEYRIFIKDNWTYNSKKTEYGDDEAIIKLTML